MIAPNLVADALLAVRVQLDRNQQETEAANLKTSGPQNDGEIGDRKVALREERTRLLRAQDNLVGALDELVSAIVPSRESESSGDEHLTYLDNSCRGSDRELVLDLVLVGPVIEPTATSLIAAIAAHVVAVQRQLTFLDEKDVGYRGDEHIAVILRILNNALGAGA